ncbi:MAG: DMT family transporter [Pikeienuella sp.]
MAFNVILLFIIGSYWGFTFALSRIVMLSGADPFVVTFWQAVGSGILVWLAMWAFGRLPRIDMQYVRFSIVVGLLGNAVPSVLLFGAAAHAGAGVLSVCMATVPLMQFGLAIVMRVEPFRAVRLLGLAMGMVSVWIIANPDTGAAPVFWVGVAILAAVCYTGESMFISIRRPADLSPAAVLGGMLIVSSIATAPLAFFAEVGLPLSLSAPGELEVAFALLIVGSPIAYGGFVFIIMRAGPVFATQVSYIVTVSGVIAGVLMLGESYEAGFWVALVLMMAGLSLSLPGGRKVAQAD